MAVEIITADCLDALPRLAADGFRVHAVVTDPPYELGFMGKTWDRTGVAFRPETWGAVRECMLPGAHLVAFGGSRTFHRLVCAIEDAGFQLRDTLMFLHGVGFPKHRNALKPAFEPMILARKPLSEGNVAANVLRHGTGAINVDACRVPGVKPLRESTSGDEGMFGLGSRLAAGTSDAGRYPANLLHDGSPEVEQAFAAFGERPTSSGEFRRKNTLNDTASGWGMRSNPAAGCGFGDTGSASRFFYTAKADANDRQGSKHPTVKPASLMRWLVRLVTPPNGTVLDPFAGTGSTGLAADQLGMDAVLIERDAQYAADARRKITRDGGLFADVREPSVVAQPAMRDLFAEAAD